MECGLCGQTAGLFYEEALKKYFRCGNCSAVFLSKAHHVSEQEEKERYEKHNNDVEDSGYRGFVAPIVDRVTECFSPSRSGLDFGAGTGPVAASMLREKGYHVELYDPFFWDMPEVLESKYDFIVCCEVIEHFRFPEKEFCLLKSMLKPGGMLFCMTDIYSECRDFGKWYYKDDPTHVFFYHRDTFEWIKSFLSFSRVDIRGRLVEFTA